MSKNLMPVVKQDWTESEAGWGRRPDGFTLHLNKADRDQFVKNYNAKHNNAKSTPSEYTFADGEPVVIDVPEEAYKALRQYKEDGKFGVWLHNEKDIATLKPEQEYVVEFNPTPLKGNDFALRARTQADAVKLVQEKLLAAVNANPGHFFTVKLKK